MNEEEYFNAQHDFETSFEETYGVKFSRIRELAAAEREGCEYFGEDIDGGGLWKCTHCDAEQIIDGGTPFTNGMGYCAGCGRPIRTIRYNKWYYNSEEDCGEREVIETIAEAALAGKGETNE